MKNSIFICLAFLSLYACKQSPQTETVEIKFETMGTFGTVKIVRDSVELEPNKIALDIDSIFLDFNNSLSTYIDSSIISTHNRGENTPLDSYLLTVVNQSELIFQETNSFNPAGKSLFEYWQYLEEDVDSNYVDSLAKSLQCFLHYDTSLTLNPISLEEQTVVSTNLPMGIDFSAIAKGYGVDVVATYLSNLGYSNYMVEIGGEVICKGRNATGEIWRLGIEEPNEEVRSIYEVVELENKAMATSGNYRNFKILENGQKVVHIINPKTGYPEISNLLSASIIADDCMVADAYATACMVMGLDTCFDFVLKHPKLDCYLIYSNESGELQSKATEGFKNRLIE